jgi:hypothetical protein
VRAAAAGRRRLRHNRAIPAMTEVRVRPHCPVEASPAPGRAQPALAGDP